MNKLHEEVMDVLVDIEKLFEGKNEQYRAADDDLANFTTMARQICLQDLKR